MSGNTEEKTIVEALEEIRATQKALSQCVAILLTQLALDYMTGSNGRPQALELAGVDFAAVATLMATVTGKTVKEELAVLENAMRPPSGSAMTPEEALNFLRKAKTVGEA